ncbi:glycosyltransferase family 2 protein [Limibacter armeniacum]|uniref:glycosyltransferase family 2 protein n=1 Tax=Limibacter armeniacum TaxID=466084 RepID=UPI002FE5C47D
MEILFWLALAVVVYTYLGYGFLLFGLVKLKRMIKGKSSPPTITEYPEVTLVVAAYNEEDFIREKIENSLTLDYPADKINFLFVTDGSDDETMDIIREYPEITLYHKPERAGKIAAVNRIMPYVTSPITIFSDANTILNTDVIKNIVRHYEDKNVGGVAGEKRILKLDSDNASGAGEGFYWRYESTLKKWDSELNSVIGAAGELFSVRTELYETVNTNILIEDFYMSLKIAMQGYRFVYEPDAYACETASVNVKEELKRKVRISAGGLQAIMLLYPLLNIFKFGILSFQYMSHRAMRWTLAPISMGLLFISNFWLAWHYQGFYDWVFGAQLLFYALVLIGKSIEDSKIRYKVFFIPYYFFMMNYSVLLGLVRLVKGKQTVIWEKAERRVNT